MSKPDAFTDTVPFGAALMLVRFGWLCIREKFSLRFLKKKTDEFRQPDVA